MKYLFLILLPAILFSCNNGEKIPDVSNVKVQLSTQRFEQDLFRLDSNNFNNGLQQLIHKFPSFGPNYLYTILGADAKWTNDSTAAYVKGFVISYKKVFDSSQALFNNFLPYENEIRNGLQFVKYYFPNYKLPANIITYIGPLDGFGDILSDDGLVIGLQLHMGKNFSLYSSELVQQTYPDYISRRFEPGYITVNCLKNIMLDLYPEKLEEKSLVQQMVEKGKRLYLLSKFLPREEEYKLIGYTPTQLKDCYEHERNIWDLFIQNNLLQSIDDNVIKNYIGESPKTQELGDASPGNIGSFAGWQIVKKYMQKHEGLSLQKLMATDDDIIFQEAKYKP